MVQWGTDMTKDLVLLLRRTLIETNGSFEEFPVLTRKKKNQALYEKTEAFVSKMHDIDSASGNPKFSERSLSSIVHKFEDLFEQAKQAGKTFEGFLAEYCVQDSVQQSLVAELKEKYAEVSSLEARVTILGEALERSRALEKEQFIKVGLLEDALELAITITRTRKVNTF